MSIIELKRGWAPRRAAACAILVAQWLAGFASAQSLTSFYADTSSYEAPVFLITDQYRPSLNTCFIRGEYVFDVGSSAIRIALKVRTSPCDGANGDYQLTISGMVSLPSPVAAGNYSVEFGYLLDDKWVLRKSLALAVDDGVDKCGRFPENNTLLIIPNPGAFERIATTAENPSLDPKAFDMLGRPIHVFRSLFSEWLGLTYARLDDQQDIKRRIDANKDQLEISSVDLNGFVCSIPVAEQVEIVEFFNATLGHYFMTENKDEILSIESGGSGPGWQRTGERITGYVADPCWYMTANSTPLFRFYGTRGIGPNSHFFTADRAECGQVRRDPGWTIENVPFRVWAPVAGQCPAMSTPVHRLYNGRAAQNDSNHRYASRQAIVDTMVAAGWTNEGVTLCIPQP